MVAGSAALCDTEGKGGDAHGKTGYAGRPHPGGRKAAGLSQEALGERLGVSRQAVSKWEADAAVPELENLIAMSRIFGVTIGALLGVEPPAGEAAAPAKAGRRTALRMRRRPSLLPPPMS